MLQFYWFLSRWNPANKLRITLLTLQKSSEELFQRFLWGISILQKIITWVWGQLNGIHSSSIQDRLGFRFRVSAYFAFTGQDVSSTRCSLQLSASHSDICSTGPSTRRCLQSKKPNSAFSTFKEADSIFKPDQSLPWQWLWGGEKGRGGACLQRMPVSRFGSKILNINKIISDLEYISLNMRAEYEEYICILYVVEIFSVSPKTLLSVSSESIGKLFEILVECFVKSKL